jgi:hypothetical protein
MNTVYKYIRVTMPDGSVWDVPAALVATDRANYYSDRAEGKPRAERSQIFYDEFMQTLDDEELLLEWAANNVSWSDAARYAKLVKKDLQSPDYQEGWCNGYKQIVAY